MELERAWYHVNTATRASVRGLRLGLRLPVARPSVYTSSFASQQPLATNSPRHPPLAAWSVLARTCGVHCTSMNAMVLERRTPTGSHPLSRTTRRQQACGNPKTQQNPMAPPKPVKPKDRSSGPPSETNSEFGLLRMPYRKQIERRCSVKPTPRLRSGLPTRRPRRGTWRYRSMPPTPSSSGRHLTSGQTSSMDEPRHLWRPFRPRLPLGQTTPESRPPPPHPRPTSTPPPRPSGFRMDWRPRPLRVQAVNAKP